MGIVYVQGQGARPAGNCPEPAAGTARLCASCHDTIRRDPVTRDGRHYCCEGCAAGGPCSC